MQNNQKMMPTTNSKTSVEDNLKINAIKESKHNLSTRQNCKMYANQKEHDCNATVNKYAITNKR